MSFDNTTLGLIIFYGVGFLMIIAFTLLYIASKKIKWRTCATRLRLGCTIYRYIDAVGLVNRLPDAAATHRSYLK